MNRTKEQPFVVRRSGEIDRGRFSQSGTYVGPTHRRSLAWLLRAAGKSSGDVSATWEYSPETNEVECVRVRPVRVRSLIANAIDILNLRRLTGVYSRLLSRQHGAARPTSTSGHDLNTWELPPIDGITTRPPVALTSGRAGGCTDCYPHCDNSVRTPATFSSLASRLIERSVSTGTSRSQRVNWWSISPAAMLAQ
jgi:hypothetical protein